MVASMKRFAFSKEKMPGRKGLAQSPVR